MKLAKNASEKRILADQDAVIQACSNLAEASAAYKRTGQIKAAMGCLTKNQIKKIRAHARNIKSSVEDVLHLCENPVVRENIGGVIFANSGRKSDGEKFFQDRLQAMAADQPLFFNPRLPPRKLPKTFLAHHGWWKGMDFLSGYDTVIELITHKFNNGQGGAQTYGSHELLRLVKTATHGPMGPGGMIEHQAEAFERFILEGLGAAGYAGTSQAILACIQDGSGRETDLLEQQKYAASSITNRQNIMVFSGNSQQYAMCRPLLYLNLLGWNHFSPQQQSILMDTINAFAGAYPDGFHGMLYQAGNHRNLLLEHNRAERPTARP